MPEESMHSMVMTVMKDSVERATSVIETNYPEPPSGAKDIGLTKTKSKLKPETKTASSSITAEQRNFFSA